MVVIINIFSFLVVVRKFTAVSATFLVTRSNYCFSGFPWLWMRLDAVLFGFAEEFILSYDSSCDCIYIYIYICSKQYILQCANVTYH